MQPGHRGVVLPRSVEHRCRAVDAGDLRMRPAGAQQAGASAGPASEIDNSLGIEIGNPPDQILAGPQTLIAELEVEIRLPHDPVSFTRPVSVQAESAATLWPSDSTPSAAAFHWRRKSSYSVRT